MALFARSALEPHELAKFDEDLERDGFVLLPRILSAEGAQGLSDEVRVSPQAAGGGGLTVVPPAQILAAFDGDAEHHGWLRDGICGGSPPLRRGVRPFNRKGRFALQCVDSPLVRQLLRRVMPDARYPPQFCHSGCSISLPGTEAVGLHQDHHHFKTTNEFPVNLAERERNGYYIQMLYYPGGFTEHDFPRRHARLAPAPPPRARGSRRPRGRRDRLDDRRGQPREGGERRAQRGLGRRAGPHAQLPARQRRLS